MSNAISARYPLQVIRTTAASVSCLASFILGTMILTSPGTLRTPYRRIIFGVAVSDIVQSLAIILSPIAQPRDTPGAKWSKGNVVSCEVAGFFMTLGTVMLPMYTFFLTIYFLLIVKYKMPLTRFASRVEWILHLVILLWNIVGNAVEVVKDNFNANFNGLCNLTGYPMNCLIAPDVVGECIRGIDAVQDAVILVQGPILFCFVGILLCLGSLTYYVYVLERQILQSSSQGQEMSWIRQTCVGIRNIFCPRRRSQESTTSSHDENEDISSSSDDGVSRGTSSSWNRLERQYNIAQKSLVQSTLYVLSYLASYLFLTIALFLQFIPKVGIPLWMVYMLSITWPLSGLFNILVYTRPKVRKLKDRFPTLPRFVLLILVIVSGGEAPPESQIRAAMRSLGIGENEPLSRSGHTHGDDGTTDPSLKQQSEKKNHLPENKMFAKV